MYRVLEEYIRKTSLGRHTLINIGTCQSEKLCDSAIHQLVSSVYISINNQEIVLVEFLNIEGAFKSRIRDVNNLGVKNTIVGGPWSC